MKKSVPETLNCRAETKDMKRNIMNARRRLKAERNKVKRLQLKSCIEEMKSSLAWTLLDAGEFANGLALYQSLPWKSHGEDKYNGISRALIEMEYFTDARKLLKKGLERFPRSCPLLVAMGLLNKRLGYELNALRYFNRALKSSPHNKHALYDKAISLSELGYYEDSLSIVNKLIKQYPNDPAYFIEKGYCRLSMGYPEDAIKYYKRAYDTGYGSPSIYGGLFCAYRQMGMKKEGLEIALEGMKEFPDVPGMYENLGEAYFESGWIDDARKVLEEGLSKFPEDERIKKILEKVETDTDNPDKSNKRRLIGALLLAFLILKNREKKT